MTTLSTKLRWLLASSTPPVRGTCSRPVTEGRQTARRTGGSTRWTTEKKTDTAPVSLIDRSPRSEVRPDRQQGDVVLVQIPGQLEHVAAEVLGGAVLPARHLADQGGEPVVDAQPPALDQAVGVEQERLAGRQVGAPVPTRPVRVEAEEQVGVVLEQGGG